MDKFDKFIFETAKIGAMLGWLALAGILLIDWVNGWVKLAIIVYLVSSTVIYYYHEFKK